VPPDGRQAGSAEGSFKLFLISPTSAPITAVPCAMLSWGKVSPARPLFISSAISLCEPPFRGCRGRLQRLLPRNAPRNPPKETPETPGLLRANPFDHALKSAPETIPESPLSPGNLDHFRQKPPANLGVSGSIQKTGGDSGIRTLGTGFTSKRDYQCVRSWIAPTYLVHPLLPPKLLSR
jgi:hypothetical protein